MRVDVTVRSPVQSRIERRASRDSHTVQIDAEVLSTSASLIDAFAAALSFPEYFGRNWGALYECFSDYFIIEDGGLGSEFGDRFGVNADAVRLIFTHAGELVRHGSTLAAEIAALLRYTTEVNSGRKAADLFVEFVVDDPDERAALEAVVTSSS